MGFLTGPRELLAMEYILPHRVKGKILIPIGPQNLQLYKVDLSRSRAGNQMIVLTIRKEPEEVDGEKVSFATHKLYYTSKMLQSLRIFISQAFKVNIPINGLLETESALKELKSRDFSCVVIHQKRLLMRDGKPVERTYVKSYSQSMMPLVSYDVILWKIGTLDIGTDDHSVLIRDFEDYEREIFNKMLKERYNKIYGTN
jgi:hypothetical protein